MTLVDHHTFLKQLTALFESKKDHGSIWLTHKRLTHDGEDSAMKHEEGDTSADTREYECLIRVTDGKTTRFSTKVTASELPKFYSQYGTLLKSSLTSLRKRDKKREKLRQEEATKRKKKMTEPVELTGSKRGKGRRARQRQIKAMLKQQESQKRFQEREEARKKSETI
ncbi:unnamed protein product [Cyclocybe aegerita]|uniref:Signal recognition particle subunit SRP14 n=1 Tax=Cyclocybe aegerita TaxID=1973307 RepID=A0A8S0VRW4_CYCAE|nr:unnamed protein product [Cyclocybe aegerita]